jgi:DNA helicase II / ATP-dependent DNA helicase PcrA
MEYSKNQLKAINLSNKNLRIIACAGSGKTSTIAAKVSYLLKTEKLRPDNIIAFTYTNRAAAELQNKILNEVGELRGMADMFIGTIHAWCLASLKDHVFEFQILLF